MSNGIVLSICCISFNHARFIRETFDSFLTQQLDIHYEIVVSDDCSTDDTPDIIAEYQCRHPDIFRVIKRDKNIGMNQNFFSTIASCRGEFIAICEGDDYWTDPLKLQKQLTILNENPEIVFTSHDVEIKNDTITAAAYTPYSVAEKKLNDFNDVILSHFIPTLSIVLRRSALPETWPEFFFHIKSPDKALVLSLLTKGQCYHSNEKMGVYRHHDGGITKKEKPAAELLHYELYLYQNLFSCFNRIKDNVYFHKLAMLYYMASRKSFQQKSVLQGTLYLAKSLSISPSFMGRFVLQKLLRE